MWHGNVDELKDCPLLSKTAITSMLTFLNEKDLHGLPNGRYELENGNYVKIVELETMQSDNVFERHEQYADVFFIIDGSEIILLGDNVTSTVRAYEETVDYGLYTVENEVKEVLLREGEMCVFVAGELHKSGIADGQTRVIKKAVFKICT